MKTLKNQLFFSIIIYLTSVPSFDAEGYNFTAVSCNDPFMASKICIIEE
jgi:hypothetical protein